MCGLRYTGRVPSFTLTLTTQHSRLERVGPRARALRRRPHPDVGAAAAAGDADDGVEVQKLLVGGPTLALKERAALASPIAAEVFAVELAFMVCEHLLFVFFVSGVTSALPKRKLR